MVDDCELIIHKGKTKIGRVTLDHSAKGEKKRSKYLNNKNINFENYLKCDITLENRGIVTFTIMKRSK